MAKKSNNDPFGLKQLRAHVTDEMFEDLKNFYNFDFSIEDVLIKKIKIVNTIGEIIRDIKECREEKSI